jgi:magnesium-transporting ATPase (P-type)
VVFAWTFVTSSSGLVVAATGADTRLGSIAQLTGEVVRRPTPLRLQMNRVVGIIAILALATRGAFFAAATWLGMNARDRFLFSVGVIVALVPERWARSAPMSPGKRPIWSC